MNDRERLRRAFLRNPPGADGRAVLDAGESHHLSRVLRVREGEKLWVFDGSGAEWEARVEEVSRGLVVVSMGAKRQGPVEPPVRVVLVQALARPEKIDWVLQKGTEVGVAAFRLVACVRGDTPPPSPSRLERYRRVVLEASKQSGRRVVPAVDVGTIEDGPGGGPGIVLDPEPGAMSLGDILAGPPHPGIALAVGPEGGFDPGEMAKLTALGWIRARLGPRVLRTETAGAIAAAIVLFAWGDLGPPGAVAGEGRPPPRI